MYHAGPYHFVVDDDATRLHAKMHCSLAILQYNGLLPLLRRTCEQDYPQGSNEITATFSSCIYLPSIAT